MERNESSAGGVGVEHMSKFRANESVSAGGAEREDGEVRRRRKVCMLKMLSRTEIVNHKEYLKSLPGRLPCRQQHQRFQGVAETA